MKRFYHHLCPPIAQMMRELYFTPLYQGRRMTQVELAEFFRCSQSTVHRAISEQSWGT